MNCRDCKYWSFDMDMDAFCVAPEVKKTHPMGRTLVGLSSPRREGEICGPDAVLFESLGAGPQERAECDCPTPDLCKDAGCPKASPTRRALDLGEQIDYHILNVVNDWTPDEYAYGYYFPFAFLESRTFLDREQIRGACRSLRNRGFMEYGVGFNEDGFTAGGGYTMTMKGETYFKGLKHRIDNN